MTLVKLHACQYRKVKRFPDIGYRFKREGLCFTTEGDPTSPRLAVAHPVGPSIGR
jgi:hypothetical protein